MLLKRVKHKLIGLIDTILSLPKSFYVSMRLAGIRNVFRLPIVCRWNCKLYSLSGTCIGNGRLYIGFNSTEIYTANHDRSILSIGGTLQLKGRVSIGAGSKICVMERGTLSFEGDVANSAATTILCGDSVTIGNGTFISWNTQIIDYDFHHVVDVETGIEKKMHLPIVVGKKVWICTNSIILKGCKISDGSIIGAGSVVTGVFEEPNVLIAGNPAKEIKSKVTWNS